jgi:ATP-binding cassette subfamily B protein AbcA/BmrA
MKKQKNVAAKAEKVSLRECLKIYDGIRMPWTQMILGLVLALLGSYAVLQVSDFSGNAVDASGVIPMDKMVVYILTSIAVVLCNTGRYMFAGIAGEKINYALRQKLWHKILVTKQSHYDTDGGESLVSRVTTDCDYASKFYSTVVNIVSLVISTAMYLVALYQINVQMANYVLLFIPVSILLGAGYTVLRFLVAYKVQSKLAASTAYLAERTKDLALIKTNNAQKKEIAEGRKYFKEQYDAQLRFGMVTAVYNVIDSMMNMLSIAVPFLVGAYFVDAGILTIGAIVTFNSLFGNVKGVFNSLITYAGDFKEANGALARITRFFNAEEEKLEEGLEIAADVQENVVFENVTFGYTEQNVVKEFNCKIPKNKITAIVGTNGSGKSTIFKLMTRLYEPDSGVIRFGETDCGTYSLHSWRRKVCLIAQGSPMMAGTIRENICYGRQDPVSEEELLKVAKLSHVYDFVKDLPNGFDTLVAAGGSNFSGGQKQCIAIARAMMSKADYLLLDEATSNLDVKREKDVMDAMNALMEGRTTVIIAHSLATIRNADHVIVIHNGELEMEGSPVKILEQTDNYLSKMMGRKLNPSTAG